MEILWRFKTFSVNVIVWLSNISCTKENGKEEAMKMGHVVYAPFGLKTFCPFCLLFLQDAVSLSSPKLLLKYEHSLPQGRAIQSESLALLILGFL